MDAKPLLKEALQAEVGLPVDRNIPLIGFIGRLEEQKGSDILAAAIPKFIGEDVQIVVLVSTHSKLFSFPIIAVAMGIILSLIMTSVVSFRELAKSQWRSKWNSWR